MQLPFLLILSFYMVQASIIVRNNLDNDYAELSFPISIISDQDKESRDETLGIWFSTLVSANLILSQDRRSATVNFLSSKNYTSKWNYDGRGMELSDLKMFHGNLITVDDKTGVVYKLKGEKALPWAILRDGDGLLDFPFKGEWLTVKNNSLYCGGYGKELTTGTGVFINDNPFWIKRISEGGAVVSLDWKANFLRIREHLDIHFPGYMIHESAQWSDIHKRWFFLPRHMSKLNYNSATAHMSGSNILLSVSEDFTNITHIVIGTSNTTRGFSAFQFVPGTNDQIVVGLKSVEIPDERFTSFIMVFDVTGRILMEEVEIPGNLKCEGVEFYDALHGIYTYGALRDEVPSRNSASGLHALISIVMISLSTL